MAETTAKKKTGKKAKKSPWYDYMNEFVSIFVPMNDSGSNEPLLIIHNGKDFIPIRDQVGMLQFDGHVHDLHGRDRIIKAGDQKP